MKKAISILFILSLFASMATGQKITAMQGKVKDGYNIWLHEP